MSIRTCRFPIYTDYSSTSLPSAQGSLKKLIIDNLPNDIREKVESGELDIEISNTIQDSVDVKLVKTNGLLKEDVENYFENS